MRIAAVEMNPLDEDADAELDQPLSKFKVLAKLGMLVDDRERPPELKPGGVRRRQSIMQKMSSMEDMKRTEDMITDIKKCAAPPDCPGSPARDLLRLGPSAPLSPSAPPPPPSPRPLGARGCRITTTLPSETFSLAQESKFGEAFMLVFGQAADTALGLPHYMKIAPALVRSGMNDGILQVGARRRARLPSSPSPPSRPMLLLCAQCSSARARWREHADPKGDQRERHRRGQGVPELLPERDRGLERQGLPQRRTRQEPRG